MSEAFILKNSEGYFYSKSGEWVDGRDASQLFRCSHRDEALNQLFEVNSKNYELRITIVECQLNSKKHPQLTEEDLPPMPSYTETYPEEAVANAAV